MMTVDVIEIHNLLNIDWMRLTGTNKEAHAAIPPPQVEKHEIIVAEDISELENDIIGTPQEQEIEEVVADCHKDSRAR